MRVSAPTPADGARARAARTKRDRTRRALLDAADATFGARGWANTRMDDIAAAAGVSAATAYNHFPSKHALMGHVYDPLTHPLLVQAEHDLAAGRPVIDALHDQVRALARVSARNRTLTAALWSAIEEYTIKVGRTENGDESDPRALAPLPRPLTMLIEHGQRTGQLRTFPAAAEAAAVVVDMLLIRSINHADEPAGGTAELLLTVLFGMLRPELLVVAGPDGRPFRGPPRDPTTAVTQEAPARQ